MKNPEEQIARELHALNRTMSDISKSLKRIIEVQGPKKMTLTSDGKFIIESVGDSQEKQSL